MDPRKRSPSTLPFGGASGWSPGRLVGVTADGRFRFDRLLGTGGLGEVYQGEDLAGGGTVAIKVLLPAFRGYPMAVRRFEREGEAARRLDHRNIVDVTTTGTMLDGNPYLVMERVDGDDLAALIEAGPLAPARAIAIVRQLLDGLEHAHARGVLHRDLKPANVMVTAADVVKILDFGLAKLVGLVDGEARDKLTETGAIFGTPVYMAPEQALGRPATPQTDLYATGVILFELLTGKPPFRGPDAQATMRLHVKGEVPPLAQDAALDAVVRRALAKTPADRFPDAAAMRAALDAIAG